MADETRSESAVTVIVAFAANAVIALAKTIAAVLTGSASMVAESAHSWADTGNEIFLFIAERRSTKPADIAHPLGYGRDTYVWSMFAAVGLFTVGAVLSIQHGVSQFGDRGPAEHPVVSYVVLGVSFLLEGASFLRAISQARASATESRKRIVDFTLNTSDPTVRAVVFEDAAALVGVLIAATGIVLHQVTGSAVWDAAGSVAVGVVLGVVAVILIQQNRRFLIGEAVDHRIRGDALHLLLAEPEIRRVTYLHLEYVGPGQVFLVAAVDLEGDEAEHAVADRLRRLSRDLESKPHVLRAILTLSTSDDSDALP